ncbi:peptide chain release factor N(5)-glutamine methyltransferase [Ammoniphilus resinae]|uniref:Release factor glutamine methyltransferase n=1 Tax=Ammoniphilus resinae TaxID=861532 RepID=A0ABS4GUR0_9BACL|nr:peptide chain release factor N(5)-glutamine methyltransferase [Ammoniphilus resinae]MBP1934007.1 release factor glutamine methyltransferase [Ammoniphilus resinae]
MNKLTIREALQRASSFMEPLEDTRFLAELFLRHVLGLTRTELFTRIHDEVTPTQWEKIEELLSQRKKGIPAQYLLGEQEFYGLPFRVNPSVLIPRPETEILVEEVLKRLNTEAPLKGADIGTGSGAIAVTLAAHSKWQIYAVDIAQESLDTAQENSRLNGVAEQLTFLKGDLLSPIPEKLDFLVSNPPYIPSQDILGLDVQVRVHEPMRALDGGTDGLDFYRRICAGLPQVLKPGGLVAFEIGIGQAAEVQELLLQSGAVQSTEAIRDLAGIERIIIGS